MTKSFGVFFRFTVLTAVHLQNANAKFHQVAQRHYSDEAVNVYIFVRQIYSGQCVPNFITIGQILQTVYQKHFGVFFFGSQCNYVVVAASVHPALSCDDARSVFLYLYGHLKPALHFSFSRHIFQVLCLVAVFVRGLAVSTVCSTCLAMFSICFQPFSCFQLVLHSWGICSADKRFPAHSD